MITGPRDQPYIWLIKNPARTEKIADKTEIINAPFRLSARLREVAAGTMMSEPMSRTPRNCRPRIMLSAKIIRNRKFKRGTLMPDVAAKSLEIIDKVNFSF